MRAWKSLFAVAVGCLFLTSSTSYSATIYGCKKKINGQVRIIGASRECLPSEVKISWPDWAAFVALQTQDATQDAAIATLQAQDEAQDAAITTLQTQNVAGKRCPTGYFVAGFRENGDLICETCACTSDMVLFEDNFDSYAEGAFPSLGGWELRYSGAGSGLQFVDETHSASAPQSLHLAGSGCWSANAYHPVAVSSRVSFEAKVFVDQIVGSGCTPILAYVALEDPDVGTWGTAYGAIFFKSDGMIYAAPENGLNGNVSLVPYVAGRWYHVLVNADLTARSFDVFIDGALAASDIPIVDAGMPKGVEVTTGHGANPVVWFDDVKVKSLPSAP